MLLFWLEIKEPLPGCVLCYLVRFEFPVGKKSRRNASLLVPVTAPVLLDKRGRGNREYIYRTLLPPGKSRALILPL